MAFSPENLKILVNSREIHAFIQTATYPLFTKGTMIWASPLSIPPSPPRCTSPTSPTQPSIAQLLCNGTVVPHAPPPSFRVNPPSAPNPFPTPLMG